MPTVRGSANKSSDDLVSPDGKGGWLVAAHADGYRLPTEAEWEYACRAGTTTQYSFGDDKSQLEQYGWFKKNAGNKAKSVALKRPNPFGLFDIHGNAQEWCQDLYDEKWYEKSSPTDPNGPSSGSTRVVRGGYWHLNAPFCRSAYRIRSTPSSRHSYFGFRCVRVADASGDSQLATNTTTSPTAPVTTGSGQPNQPWNTPAFQAWVKATQALPAEKQIEAVSKKLMELNPGFDGRCLGIGSKGNPLRTDLQGRWGEEFRPATPRTLPIFLAGASLCGVERAIGCILGVVRLVPLQGMGLTKLICSGTKVSDLSPLKVMPLKDLAIDLTAVTDYPRSKIPRSENLGLPWHQSHPRPSCRPAKSPAQLQDRMGRSRQAEDALACRSRPK